MKLASAKRVALILIVLVLCVFAFRSFMTRRPNSGQRVLRIGINQSPPYSTIGPDGVPRGFSVDVIREAARRTGLRIQLVVAPEGPDVALPTGKVDIWPLLIDLPERHEKMLFTDAWMRTSYVLLVRRESSIQDAQGAVGRSISVSNLLIHTRLARKSFPLSTLLPVPLGNELNGVCVGAADAAIIGKKELLSRLLHRTPECEAVSLRVVPLRQTNYRMGMAANKDAFPQAKLLRQAIAEMSVDSTLANIYRAWLNDAGDEIAIVNELQQVTRRNGVLYWASTFLALIVGLLAWLIYGKARAETAARAASEFTSAVVDATGGLVLITDRRGAIVCFNRACQSASGKSFDEVKGKSPWDLFVPAEERSTVKSIHAALLAGRPPASDEHHWRTISGNRLYSWSNSVLTDAAGETKYVITNGVDISEREETERRLLLEANSDPLTGLLNRRGLALELDCALAEMRGGSDLWLGVADLDSFKTVNDDYGHSAGDDVLVVFGSILREICAESGAAARLGGDEFCFVLRAENPHWYVNRVQQALGEHKFHSSDGRTFRVAASIGGAAWNNAFRNSADLLQAADESLYRTKRMSRNHAAQSDALYVGSPKNGTAEHGEESWLAVSAPER